MSVKTTFSALLLLTIIGCGTTDQGNDPTVRTHRHVVIDDLSRSKEIIPAFEEFQQQAMYRPGSTFVVYLAGQTRDSYELPFICTVPKKWPQPVITNRNMFFAKAVAALRSLSKTPLRFPEDAIPPHELPVGTHAVTILASPTLTRLWQRAIPQVTIEPIHFGVVVDLSGSSFQSDVTNTFLQATFSRFLLCGGHQGKASFSVYGIGASRDTTIPLFHGTIPDIGLGERVAYAFGLLRELEALSLPPKTNYSAIIESLNRVVSEIRERPGKCSIFIHSDMRQSTFDRLHFESKVPNPEAFMSFLEERKLVQDLHGIPIIAVGVHNNSLTNQEAFTAEHAQRLQNAWTYCFRKMGAEVEFYTSVGNAFPDIENLDGAL